MSASAIAPGTSRAGGAPRTALWSGADLWAVAGLTVLAAVIRFLYIGHQGFWFDEGNTALLISKSPGAMLGLIPQTESTPPLYYMVAWVWVRIFGNHEAGLRSLSAVAGVLTVPVAWAAARELVSGWRTVTSSGWMVSRGSEELEAGRRAGLITAALTASNPFLIWYSQEARSYALLAFLSALGLLFFAYARANPNRGPLTGWVIASALAMVTHYYAAILVVPEAVWLLWEHGRVRRVHVAVGLGLACGAALIPLALSQNSTGRDSWIANSPFSLRLAQIIPQFLIGTGAPARQVLKFVAMALALLGVATLLIPGWMRERRGALLAGGLAVSGFLITLILAAAGSDFLITRNIIVLWLPAAIALAGGLAVAPRWLGGPVAGGLCVIGLVAAIGVDANYNLQRPNWRPVAAALGPAPTGGRDRVLLIQHYRTLLPLSLYMPRLAFVRGRDAAAHHVTELDVISFSSPQQPLCWWGAACNLIPSQMQSSYDIPGFREVSRRQVEQFTIVRLVARRPVTLSASEVSRALQTTELRHDGLLAQRS